MPITRLTIPLREAILVKAEAFGERKRQLDLEISDLGFSIYMDRFGDKIEAARALGPEWVCFNNHLSIEADCWNRCDSIDIALRPERAKKNWPMPYENRHTSLELEPGQRGYAELRALSKKQDKLYEETKQFQLNLKSVMSGCTTVEKLRLRWPECDKVLPLHTDETIPRYEIVPASLINDINRQLGIPPPVEDGVWSFDKAFPAKKP